MSSKKINYLYYSKFLSSLAKELTKFYYLKLNKNFKVSNKLKGRGYDPVTTSDKAFEKFIRSKINKKFPTHQIIGEEFGFKKTKSDFSWVIDPIDGTRSFVIGNPSWSNLISLCYKNKPVIGLANFPELKKFYLNTNSSKAYLIKNNKKTKLKVSKEKNFKKMKLSGNFHGYYSLDQMKKVKKILPMMQFPCMDALSYSHFCEGKIDVVFQCGNKIWDIYPLIPIIKAAGGIVTNWKNEEPINGGNILVSANKKLHSQMLKILKPLT